MQKDLVEVFCIKYCAALFHYFFRNTMEAVPANRLADVHSMGLQVCVIGIDEGQFVSLFFRSRLHLGGKSPSYFI